MTLDKALYIIARSHTRDDDLTGFVVEWAPSPSIMWEHSQAEYIEAWKTVRAHIHFQTEPATAPSPAAASDASERSCS